MSNNSGIARNSQLIIVRSTTRTRKSSDRFVRLSHLRKLSECEQVAAVCYRMRGTAIEFLLVRTRGAGRWTFPKGSAEPGLTHAQAAALEAFEEAGVHGRIEEASFASYRRKPIDRNRTSRSGEKRVAVSAFLCEVLRLSPPQESKRDRSWFSSEEARRSLRQGRENAGGAEFARVIDKAIARIQQLHGAIGVVNDAASANPPQQNRLRLSTLLKDALQKVQFDFAEAYGSSQRTSTSDIRRQLSGTRLSAASIVEVHSCEVPPCEILEFSRARQKKSKDLVAGSKIG